MKHKNYQGISLMEVVVSLFLLSFILMGFDAMSLSSMHENNKAWIFSNVVHQLNEITQELQAMKTLQGVDEMIGEWNKQNQMLLPNGYGSISGKYPHYSITLTWGGYQDLCVNNTLGMSGCWKINLE